MKSSFMPGTSIRAALALIGALFLGLSGEAQTVINSGTTQASISDFVNSDSNYVFNNSSVLKVTANHGVSGGTVRFNDNSQLNAHVGNSVSGGTQNFYGSSSLQATASGLSTDDTGVISGGTQNFYDTTLLKAGVTNSISGGVQNFFNNAILTASGANAITGGTQSFGSEGDTDSTHLTRLVINSNGSISGSTLYIYGYSSVGANVSNAVGDETINLFDHGTVKLGADNALSSGTELYFNGENGGVGGILNLNGHSTEVGEINSGTTANPSPGFIENDGSGNQTLTISGDGDSIFDGVIRDNNGSGGTVSIVKTSGSVLRLSGANTFSGGLTVENGELQLGSSSDSGLTQGPVGTGTLTLLGGTYLTPYVCNVTLGNAITLQSNYDNFVHIDDDESHNNLTLTGIISGDAGLDWCTLGTLTLSNGNSTFGGGLSGENSGISVDMRSGTLLIGASSIAHYDVEFGNVIDSGPVGTGTLALYDGTKIGVAPDSGSQTLHNLIYFASDGGTVTVDTSNGDLKLLGDIIGDSELKKTGSGTLTLGGSGDFSGGVSVHGGTLALANSSSNSDGISGPLGRGELKLFDGTTLSVAHGAGDITLHNAIALDCIGSSNVNFDISSCDSLTLRGVISGAASLTKTGGGYLTLTRSETYSGGTVINEGFLVLGDGGCTGMIAGNVLFTGNTDLGGGELMFQRSDNFTFSGDISGPGRVSQFGSGTVTLSGNNTYGGDTFVNSGALTDDSAGRFSANSIIRVNSGAALSVGYNETIAGLDDYFTATSGNTSLGDGVTLTINSDGENNVYSGVISGNGNIVKSGTSSQTFAGINTYGGTTTVNGGMLVAGNASAFGTSTITINGGGISVASGVTLNNPLVFAGSAIVLGGNGTFGSLITVNSHVVLSPGNSPGNLTFSAGLALAAGGAISFQVYDASGTAGTGWDLITISGGTFDLTSATPGSITFNLVSIDGSNNNANAINFNDTLAYHWIFATASNPIVGFNSSSSQFNIVSSFTNNLAGGTFSITESGNNLMLNFTPAAVPEPSTWALLGLGLGCMVVIAYRRRVAA
ncbi:MAG TPA: autotransporter-associated beta strand repeat-containing protein [Opitutaceae bacterium]|nr:autotransporter-associated beta strand repeat-containing protein [Opitutaceae bacterium]